MVGITCVARKTSYKKSPHPHTPTTNVDRGSTDKKESHNTDSAHCLPALLHAEVACPEQQKLLTVRGKRQHSLLERLELAFLSALWRTCPSQTPTDGNNNVIVNAHEANDL